MVDKFLNKMYRTNADFVWTVTRDFVRNCRMPVLILPDDTPPHPYVVAMEAAMLAPKAEVSMFPWKEPKERIPWRCARYVPSSGRTGSLLFRRRRQYQKAVDARSPRETLLTPSNHWVENDAADRASHPSRRRQFLSQQVTEVAMEPNLHTDADKYQAGMGGWSKTLAPLFIEFIGGIKEGDRVLDVGCGTGSLTFTIADTTKASTVVGIDPSVGYLEYARHIIHIRTFLLKSGMLRNFPMILVLSTAAYHH